MKLIISTVKRPVDYLDRCIDSIRQDYDGKIDLMIGGKEFDYLEKYQEPDYIKHYVEEEGLENGVNKAAKGYCDCLTCFKKEPVLIVEDDTVFVPDWYQKLEHLLEFVKDEKYILSFITPWAGSVPVPEIDVPSLQPFQYNANIVYRNPGEFPQASIVTWVNSSAVYYPPSVLETDIADFVDKFSVRGKAVYDLSIGYYLFRMNIPIYIAVPNLLEPIPPGDISAMGTPGQRLHEDYTQWDWEKYAN